MNWACLRLFPWFDTRAAFVARAPLGGNLLDLGSSDGETLRHIAELRPDLRLFAADIFGAPEKYPPRCQFARADLQRESLPWADASMSAITCMHLVEHLQDLTNLMRESSRLLRPGAQIYIETPHPRSLGLPSLRQTASPVPFTLNFYDDSTHIKIVTIDDLSRIAQEAGLEVLATGVSRNWLFAASHLFYRFLPPGRKKYTAQVHWVGWSACLTARRPPA